MNFSSRKCQRACERLDLDDGIGTPPLKWFWPIREKAVTTSEEDDDGDDTADAKEETTASDESASDDDQPGADDDGDEYNVNRKYCYILVVVPIFKYLNLFFHVHRHLRRLKCC